MRVLLISVPIGAGHMRAAQAVASALKRQKADTETQIANIFSFIAPQYEQAVLKSYLKILASFPAAYGRLYAAGNTNILALWGRDLISRYLAKKMRMYIEAYRPAAIICTHATPAGLAAHLLKTEQINIPVMAVITDYVVHRLWVYPEIHRYFVADDALREYLCSQGIAGVRSQTTGIPVEYVFREAANRLAIFESLGLNPAVKTVLMMGGGAGLLPMKELLESLKGLKEQLQLIVITGHNILLYEELKKLQTSLHHTLRVLGYVDNVHEIMSAADVLISKPGGMTTAEALCRGLPLILYRPIPGQEEANARFLKANGAALCAHSAADVTKFVYALLLAKDNGLLANLQKNILRLQRPLAADSIAKSVLSESFP
ncbi:MAG: glycosyltransferase [Pelosinus sp.]|nr:glycosyltransferase [Pelosinus sp.]